MDPSPDREREKQSAQVASSQHHSQAQPHPQGHPHHSASVGCAVPVPPPTIEKLCRPAAFDKMELLVREMQDGECGVPVRSQKLFLTSIPSAFMGYDLIEWLMERLGIEESEALNIANHLCLHGYFFPVNDSKILVVKDDSSLYRFQTPYFWPWQHKAPDNIEYAIYLTKRSLRNKQRHGLEEYETETQSSLHKNLKGKWDFITMQAEEQVRLSKERKKGDKIVGDSQERAYWRVHRPPPGQFTPLEPCPVPSRDRKLRKRTVEDWQREVDFLTKSLTMTRMKMSQACELLIQYYEVFAEFDHLMQPALPSNPWVSEDTTFWQLNSAIVELPTEKRVKRWSISIEELVSDPTGLNEFTNYLKKEYSHENIRFWITVNDLRRSAHSQISKKVSDIYEEFLEPGAPCEINIDGKTMEKVQQGLKCPTRFTFDAAAEHIYALLLKKDCYPRFIRSEHYKTLLASGIQPSHKKRFFGFGGAGKKKTSTATAPNAALLAQAGGASVTNPGVGLGRRRGSDRSLTGSAHELAVSGVKDASSKVPHSHSQSNLCDIPYRGDMPCMVIPEKTEANFGASNTINKIQETSKLCGESLEVAAAAEGACVCPWDATPKPTEPSFSVSICPWDEDQKPTQVSPKIPIYLERASDIGEVSERMKRSCGLRQSTLDSDFHSSKNLMPDITSQRRASITITPRISEYAVVNQKPSHGSSVTGVYNLNVADQLTNEQNVSQLSIDSSVSLEDRDVNPIVQTVSIPPQNSVSLHESFLDEDAVPLSFSCLSRRSTPGEQQPPPPSNIDFSSTSGHVCDDCLKECETFTVDTDHSSMSGCYGEKTIQNKLNSSSNLLINDENDKIVAVLYENDNITNDNNITLGSDLINCVGAQTTSMVSDGYDLDQCQAAAGADQQLLEVALTSPLRLSPTTIDDTAEDNAKPLVNLPQLRRVNSFDEDEAVISDPSISECELKKCEPEAYGHKRTSHPKCHSTDVQSSEDFEYEELGDDGSRSLQPGCVAPAPTPAPSIAPLAEVEQDPQDDEYDDDDSYREKETIDEMIICDKLQRQLMKQPSSSIGLETQLSNESEMSKTESLPPPPNITATLTESERKDMVEPVPVYPSSSPHTPAVTTRRRRKKRENTDSKTASEDGKDEHLPKTDVNPEELKGNPVCPWEDENASSSVDVPFVKTYATLGYL